MVMTTQGLNEIRDWLTRKGGAPPTHTGIGTNRTRVSIDDCEDNPGDWVEDATTDANTPVLDALGGFEGPAEGSNTIKLPTTIATTAETLSRWDNTTYDVDLSAYEDGHITMWIYIPAGDEGYNQLPTTDTVLSFMIGNDSNNFLQFDWKKASLHAGFNYREMDLNNPTSETGTMDWASNVNFLRIEVHNTDSADYNVYIDAIYAETENVGVSSSDTTVTTEIARKALSGDNNQTKVANLEATFTSTDANYEKMRTCAPFNDASAGDPFSVHLFVETLKTPKLDFRVEINYVLEGQ